MEFQKKDIFIEKSCFFFSVLHIFSNQNKFCRIYFLCFFLSLIFDYWWLHVPKSFDVKKIYVNNENLGKLPLNTHAAKMELSKLEK